jgi:TRAP-type mannitol/chloroaromatic compound transport system permease large subunit
MPVLEILAILMLVAFFVLLLAGIPVGLTLATTGFVFGYLGFGMGLFNLLPHRIFGVVTNYTLLAIPLFVFMGVMLEKSRLAEELMDVIGLAAGSLRGGLGIGIILVGVLMGATTGIVGATVVTLGLLTLPGMLRRGYDRGLACGTICASGTLGQIIPRDLLEKIRGALEVVRTSLEEFDSPGRQRRGRRGNGCSISGGADGFRLTAPA